MLGALAAALATTGLLWTQLAPFSGIFGYIVVSWILFVLIYALLVSFDNKKPTVRDRISAVVVQSLAAVVILALAYIVLYTVFKRCEGAGAPQLLHAGPAQTTGIDPLTKGGVLHAIVGTLIEVGIAMGIAVPLGLLAAVFLNEVPGPLNRFVRTVVDAMTALPDILAGLFIYATLILIFGLGCPGWPRLRARGDRAVHRLPGGLRRAAAGARRPDRGLLRTRLWAVAHGVARDAADRAVRAGHRGDPRRRAGDRRDRPGAADGRRYRIPQLQSGERADDVAAAGGLHLVAEWAAELVARGFGAAAVLLAARRRAVCDRPCDRRPRRRTADEGAAAPPDGRLPSRY